MARKNEQYQACMRRAREYRMTAKALYRQLDDLDDSDPEWREAAREWSMQAAHAEYCANEAERYAQYALED